MQYITFNNLLLTFWFSLVLLIIYGSARGLEYTYAPFFVLVSLGILIKTKSLLLENKLIKIIICFIILTIISSINWIYFPKIGSYSYFQYLNYSVCAFFATLSAYSFTVSSNDNELKFIKICTIIIFCVGIIRFFHSYSLTISLSTNNQSNAFYYILMPLPLVFLLNKQKVNFVFFIICSILCILSAKRSALVAIVLISLTFLYNSYKLFSKWHLLLIVISVLLLSSYVINNEEFLHRLLRVVDRMNQINDDGGSGRVGIIVDFFEHDINYILHYPEILIGNGFESYSIYHNRVYSAAHNDFLEILFAYGLIGLILLFCFFVYIFNRVLWSFKNENRKYMLPCSTAFILFIVFSSVANNFYFFFNSLPLFLYLGVSEAIFDERQFD